MKNQKGLRAGVRHEWRQEKCDSMGDLKSSVWLAFQKGEGGNRLRGDLITRSKCLPAEKIEATQALLNTEEKESVVRI